jgi:hypothetical protein
MQTPAVRAAVVAAEHAFQAVSVRIADLSAYKAIHDHFMKLEPGYEMLVQLQKRASANDPTAWDELDVIHWPEFQTQADRLVRCAEATSFAAGEAIWIETLRLASTELAASIPNRSLEQLSSATAQINKLLEREPSRLNNSLVTTAQNLRLATLVQALTTIREAVAGLALTGETEGHCENFDRGVDAVENLNLSLACLVLIHSRLQAIYDEVYPRDPLLFRDMREFENNWRYQRLKLQKLKEAGETEWLATLRTVGDQLEQAVTVSRNFAETRRLFQDYRRRASRTLDRADRELLALCGQLQKVGDKVATLLREMQHG